MANVILCLAGFPIKEFDQFKRESALAGVLRTFVWIEFDLHI